MHPPTLFKAALCKVALTQQGLDTMLPDKVNPLSEYFLMPGAYRRAGRARGLADAYGVESGMGVRQPLSRRTLLSVPLGLLGAAGGTTLAHLLGGEDPQELNKWIAIGAAAGGSGGLVLGNLIDSILRRREVKRIKKEVAQEMGGGPTGRITKPSLPSGLVAGVHHQGVADASDAAFRGLSSRGGNPAMAAMQLGTLIPYAGGLFSLPYMAGSVANAGEAHGRLKSNIPHLYQEVRTAG